MSPRGSGEHYGQGRAEKYARSWLSGSNGEIMYAKPSSLLDSQVPNVMVVGGLECTNNIRCVQRTTHLCFSCSNLYKPHGLATCITRALSPCGTFRHMEYPA